MGLRCIRQIIQPGKTYRRACFAWAKAVADPEFPVGGWGAELLGGTDLRCRHFSVKTYAKTKELDPVGGHVLAAPPGSANEKMPMASFA